MWVILLFPHSFLCCLFLWNSLLYLIQCFSADDTLQYDKKCSIGTVQNCSGWPNPLGDGWSSIVPAIGYIVYGDLGPAFPKEGWTRLAQRRDQETAAIDAFPMFEEWLWWTTPPIHSSCPERKLYLQENFLKSPDLMVLPSLSIIQYPTV